MLTDAVAVLERSNLGGACDGRSACEGVGVGEGSVVGGLECILERRSACEAGAALDRFKRVVSVAGRFAHYMHAESGAPVRGVQGAALRLAAAGRACSEVAGKEGAGVPAPNDTVSG